VAERIATHHPRFALRSWNSISAFVRLSVTDLQPASVNAATLYLSALVKYVDWTWSLGVELERTNAFNPELINNFVATEGISESVASRLRRMASILNKTAPTPAEDGRGRASHPMHPYSQLELASFYSWALGQNSVARQQKALCIVSMGAGAGLSMEEIQQLKVGDVATDGLSVRATSKSITRTIPLLAEWVKPAGFVIAERAADDWLFSGRREVHRTNRMNEFMIRSSGIGPRPVIARLRATWIVTHLQAGTPYDVLVEASGISSGRGFAKYIPYLHRTQDEKTAALRDATGIGGHK